MLREITQIVLLFLLVFALSGCKDREDQVPYVLVDVTLLLNLPEFSSLTVPSGYAEISGGSLGIIVYRSGQNEFVAHDRHCTHNVNDFCRVHVNEDDGVTATCECCDSVFSIQFGVPSSGPAARSLTRYRTNFNGNTNELRIFN